MSTFILTWNADRWDWEAEDREQEISDTNAGFLVDGRWSTGNRKSGIQIGDRAFLLQQGRTRGMVGSGWFTSEVFQEQHWADPDRQANYADVEWDVLLSDDDLLATEELKQLVPGVEWDNLLASGLHVSEDAATLLETLWEQRYGSYQSPEEEPAGSLTEGAVTRVTVNRYERSPAARTACIDHYGCHCQACGLDFSARYGPIGNGFIHVHHVIDLSQIGEEYVVDPVADLRPVCPNCHAMLHTTTPAMSVEELRKIIHEMTGE